MKRAIDGIITWLILWGMVWVMAWLAEVPLWVPGMSLVMAIAAGNLVDIIALEREVKRQRGFPLSRE